jgi:hypothetical protein
MVHLWYFGIIWAKQFFAFPSEPILVEAVYVAKMLDPFQSPRRSGFRERIRCFTRRSLAKAAFAQTYPRYSTALFLSRTATERRGTRTECKRHGHSRHPPWAAPHRSHCDIAVLQIR